MNLVSSTGDQRARDGSEVEHVMSDEFDALDATEKAGFEAALNRDRCRLAAQIASELREKTPLTSWRWQTFAPPLSTLPMSSDRKANGRSRNTYSRGEGFGGAAPSVIIEGDLRLPTLSRTWCGFCWSST